MSSGIWDRASSAFTRTQDRAFDAARSGASAYRDWARLGDGGIGQAARNALNPFRFDDGVLFSGGGSGSTVNNPNNIPRVERQTPGGEVITRIGAAGPSGGPSGTAVDWTGDSAGTGPGSAGPPSTSSWAAPTVGRTVLDQSMLGSTAHVDRALKDLGQARQEALNERAGLDAQFEQRMASLREQFQFTESAEERRMIADMLGELERQRDAGYQAIAQGYQRAAAGIRDRQAGMAEQTAAEQAAVGNLYDGAVAQVQGGAAGLNALYDEAGGGALGVGSDGGAAGAGDWAALLAAEGAAEQALTGRLGDISAENVGWMADTLGGQQLAQQGDLNRMAMATSAQAQMEHQRRVQERIQQERMLFNQMYGQTRDAYDQRGWSLGDQARDILGQQGDLRFRAGESQVQRQLEAAMQQAQLDAQRASQNAEMQAQARAANAAARNQASLQAHSAQAQGGAGHSVPDMLMALSESPTAAHRDQLASYLIQNHGLPPEAARQMGVNVNVPAAPTTTGGQYNTAATRNMLR